MKKYIFYFSLILLINASCVEDEPDIFGDVLVRVDPPPTLVPNVNVEFEVGIFPSEVLISNEYTANLAIKTATTNERQAIITDVLPGTYVVAFVSTSNVIPSRQVVQIVADKVSLVDFDLNPLNDE